MDKDYNRQKVESLIYFHKSNILPLLEKIINNMVQDKPPDPIAYIVMMLYDYKF